MRNKMILIVKRLIAAVIDFYIICFLSIAVVFAVIFAFSFKRLEEAIFVLYLYIFLVILLTVIKDVALNNRSIGKRILGIKIEKTDNGKFTFVDAIIRTVPIVFVFPIEVILMLFANRRIGDIFAKTSIVQK